MLYDYRPMTIVSSRSLISPHLAPTTHAAREIMSKSLKVNKVLNTMPARPNTITNTAETDRLGQLSLIKVRYCVCRHTTQQYEQGAYVLYIVSPCRFDSRIPQEAVIPALNNIYGAQCCVVPYYIANPINNF